ncbi:EscI/YscI/HrpB family type III secretion system inner rod protein [Sansalvadorimonas sp. 2012CJ34-2]|uniref:EscI/YscI/HrpB family type III secretion system inner rod protein n=1 Tax=Parendozoicomonas callyspongiae TaxID=2942213 RepID=A0ABT0PGP7_9GAMM|nr:EscI/YscI/HrpB family type III secretion system inner rod protein [Sansalvadorimonas sp. 2012CJ34-2]MCL6270559.1 EscI/YscI/HrpB family type III secretion system inner rod protein [Sansalvadorimonas sp. 2012CJ34-2]
MPSPGVSNIGTATEKALTKQDHQQLDELVERPDDKDADNFNALLEQGFKNESETNLKGGEVQLKEAPNNLGDKILNAFQGMKDNIDTSNKKVDKMLNTDEIMSMQDMFKTQKAMTNLMMTQDLIGKVVGKGTQTVETMMKQQ